MSTTLFLSPSPLQSKSPNFLPCSTTNYFLDSSIHPLIPISLKNPKPINSTSNSTTAIDDNNDSTNQAHQFPSQRSNLGVKVHTPPWIRGPITLEPNQLLDLSNQRNKKKSLNDEQELTGRVSGGRGKRTMKKVFEGIDKLIEKRNAGEKLNILTPNESPRYEYDFGLQEIGDDEGSKFGGRLPWERDERVVFRRMKKEKKVTAAELELDGDLLERLRDEASRIRKWVKVKKLGVTDAVVDQILLIWKDSELAMLKFDIPLCRNMDRAREIVEIKTKGLVVWCKEDMLVVYRGRHYRFGSKLSKTETWVRHANNKQHNLSVFQVKPNYQSSILNEEESRIPVHGSLFEREADRLLEGLGPRFIDWWYHKPLPVDADLLPESVPGFKTPFRLCPPNVRSNNKLTDDELTHLRNLARPLPTHFVLGRNKKLQGLAAAILKLWEKCHIAKIAVKMGIPNTDNEQMANELKHLTGGTLLLRNKFFIVLYRGKDFLPNDIANQVAERETELGFYQNEEEFARHNSVKTFYLTEEPSPEFTSAVATGTLSEFRGIISEGLENRNIEAEVEKERVKKELKTQENKLFILKKKIKRTGRELAKLNSSWRPSEDDEDRELITHEEKECFRKIGLKMDKCLVLGRRGIFDGVIEGIHQHWKHRELVKVITMQRVFSQVIYTAKLVEAESGGVLVAVEKLKEGHAIILYRGKNYRRPLKLIPQNLLNKQDALRRSLDLQRIGSLKFFAHQREKKIYELKHRLAEVQKEGDSITENETSL